MRRIIGFLGICLLLAAVGCASGISQHARSQVTYHGSFAELHGGPDKYQGEIVMLGGRVIETKTFPTFSEITMLQLPLGTNNKPKESDRSEGRFLIRSNQFLDPAIYEKEGLVTVVGYVRGGEVRSIGDFPYAYPVVEAVELKPWAKTVDSSPSVHFGVGVGTSF